MLSEPISKGKGRTQKKNSSLPFWTSSSQILFALGKSYFTSGPGLARASGNEKLLVQQENLLVPDDSMAAALFSSPGQG